MIAGLSNLVVEVLHNRGDDNHPDWSVGSGFFVGTRQVLTALHNVDGPGELLVRLHGTEERPAVVRLQGDKDLVDLAVLEVSDVAVDVPPIHYGAIDRSASAVVERCWAVGFPRFKERVHDPKPLRLSAQVNGEIPTGENLDQPLLTLQVRRSPRPLPSSAVRESEWAGMSGAAVFSGNNTIVGVITEHHLPEGESALTVVPITAIDLLPEAEVTKWWELLGVDRQAFVRLPGDAHVDHPTTYLPFPRNRLFQPRPGEFERLETLLLRSDAHQQYVRVGLVGVTGMGGIGKTELAVEFAYRYQDRFPAGIFWVPGTGHTYSDWQRQFAELARNTDYLPANDDISNPENEMRRARHFCRYLARHADALLILDNVEDPGLLISVLPALAGGESACSLLYTSRVTRVPAGFVPYQVKKLPQEAALRLLLASTRPALLTEILQGSQGEEAQAAQAICNMVDNLPLALVHLRSLLDIDRDMMLTALLATLQAQGALEIANDVDPDAASLIATFRLSWEKVKEAEAQRLFKLAAYFPEAAPIPLWLLGLATGLGEKTEGFTPLGKMWIRLQQLSLLEKLSKEQVSLQPLVREFGQRLVVEDGPEGKALLEEACERLVSAFTNLNTLEQRTNQQGYWGCLQQVRAARDYAALLQAEQLTPLAQIERWFGRESHLLADEHGWRERLPGLFYQQLVNRAVEEDARFLTGVEPPQWLRQMNQVGAEDRSLIRLFTGHTGTVNSVAFSPDGSQVLTGSSDYTARLWETKSGTLLCILQGHTSYVNSVAFSPDGSLLLTGSDDVTARLWEAKSGTLLRILGLGWHTMWPDIMAFSPDGSLLFTASGYDAARLWETKSGTLLCTLQGRIGHWGIVAFSPDGSQVLTGSRNTAQLWETKRGTLLRILEGHMDSVRSVAFSPDGSQVLTGSEDHTARLWETKSGSLLRILQGHSKDVTSVAFSPNGSQILTGSSDHTARLWETKSGSLLYTLQAHTQEVASVAFSPDGSLVLTGSWDHTARLWETKSGSLLRILEGHTEGVRSVSFSPDGSLLLTGSYDGTARLWETKSGSLLHILEGDGSHIDTVKRSDETKSGTRYNTSSVNSVAFSPDGSQVFTCSPRIGSAQLWDTRSGALLRTLGGHSGYVKSVAFSPNGSQILTGSSDHTARLWETKSGTLLYTLQAHPKWVNSVAFSPDGSLLLTGSNDHTARLWEAKSGTLLHTLKGHSDEVNSVAFSSDGSQVLTGSDDKTARLWETKSGSLLRILQGHSKDVTSVAFSPDGSQVLTGSDDWAARLWETKSGTLLHILEGGSGEVSSVAFSPDGSQILTSSRKTARLWAAKSGSMLRTQGLEERTGSVINIAFSPDGSQVVTGLDDGTVQLWEAKSSTLLRTLKGHTNTVDSVAFSPNGSQVLTGSWDHTARLWEAKSGTLLHILKGHTGTVNAVAFSPDGSQVLTGSSDQTARLWETKSGILLHTLGEELNKTFPAEVAAALKSGTLFTTASLWKSRAVDSVAFSPDGSLVLTGSRDYTARLWAAKSGLLLRTLEGTGYVESVAFSPDGSLLLTGSTDGIARLWEAKSGSLLHTLKGYTGSVYMTTFSPDGRFMATCESNGWVFFWRTYDTDMGKLVGLYVASFNVAAIYWQDATHVILADIGGLGGIPHFYHLKLVGIERLLAPKVIVPPQPLAPTIPTMIKERPAQHTPTVSPRTKEQWLNEGNVYYALQQYDKAIADYSQALQLDPKNVDVYYNRGLAYYALQQYDKAIADFSQALELNPKDAGTYNNRGVAYKALQQYDKAIADYSQALQLDPKNAGTYYNRGLAYYALQQYDKAIADFSQALELNPKDAGTYNNRGNVYYALQQYDKAIADFSQALELNPKDALAYYHRGLAYKALQQYDKAIADYSQALELNPKDAFAYNSRGNAYKELQQYDKAFADFSQALQLDPKNAFAYDGRGSAYYALQQYDKAIADYSQALQLDPKNADVYYNRGLAYYALQQYDKAIKDYDQTLQLNPTHSNAQKWRQEAYRLLHRK